MVRQAVSPSQSLPPNTERDSVGFSSLRCARKRLSQRDDNRSSTADDRAARRGSSGTLGSNGVDFKLWGTDTGGAVSIVEHPFPVGALVRPHLHTREDEYSIVRERSVSDPVTAKSSSVPVDTSPNRATMCTPCGTPRTCRLG